jgi:hypothetical protein
MWMRLQYSIGLAGKWLRLQWKQATWQASQQTPCAFFTLLKVVPCDLDVATLGIGRGSVVQVNRLTIRSPGSWRRADLRMAEAEPHFQPPGRRFRIVCLRIEVCEISGGCSNRTTRVATVYIKSRWAASRPWVGGAFASCEEFGVCKGGNDYEKSVGLWKTAVALVARTAAALRTAASAAALGVLAHVVHVVARAAVNHADHNALEVGLGGLWC